MPEYLKTATLTARSGASDVRATVQELFSDIHRLMRAELQKQLIELSTEVLPAGLKVWADRRLLEQMLINLLTNSRQALQDIEQAQIRLIGKETDGQTILEVADNGPGIPEDKLDKIFVPFFSTKEKGSGIGLSLSRNIMNLHSGRIKVNAPPGGPTIFSLSFPKSSVLKAQATQNSYYFSEHPVA